MKEKTFIIIGIICMVILMFQVIDFSVLLKTTYNSKLLSFVMDNISAIGFITTIIAGKKFLKKKKIRKVE